MREILEICQKCDMKYDKIDLHLSTTIVHIKCNSPYPQPQNISICDPPRVASFSSFPWVGIEISATSTQVALLIVTDKQCLSTARCS
jgi:hypothetical protein